MMMPHEKGTFIGKLLVFQKPKAPIRDSESRDELDISDNAAHIAFVDHEPCAYGVITSPEYAPSNVAILRWRWNPTGQRITFAKV